MGDRTDTDVGRALEAIAAPSMRYHSFPDALGRRPEMTPFTLLRAALPEVAGATAAPSPATEPERVLAELSPAASGRPVPFAWNLPAPGGEKTVKLPEAPPVTPPTIVTKELRPTTTALTTVFRLLQDPAPSGSPREQGSGLRTLLSSL